MTPRAQQISIFAFVFLSNLCLAAPGAAAVTLKSETEVNRPVVRLSDVFDGLPAGIDCDIARAPAPGKSITYDVNVLAGLMHQYKLDWQPQNLSDHTTITTAGSKITADDIRAAVIGKVKALDVKGDIDVMFDNHVLELTLPADRAPDFTLNDFSFDAINKRFHATLLADGFTGPVSLTVSGRITVRHNVPVLARRLEAGTQIGAADIDWLSVPSDRMSGIVTEAENLIGHELRRDTDAGQPVSERDVGSPRFVVRGTLVTMKIETPVMMVTAQGRALQDGKLGDVVRVTNTQSNRTVEGTVESAGVVRIQTARQLAAFNDVPGKQE
jgi:flagella basal body P-ring formation protein FlgA